MAWIVGAVLALVAGVFGTVSGFDRERSYYATIMIVIAVLYALFAVLGGTRQALVMELVAGSVFIVLAVAGFKRSLWLVAFALAAHGIFDFVHGSIITNAGVPAYWPAFCGTYDVVAAGWVRIVRGRIVLASVRELRVRPTRPEGVGQSATIHGIVDSDLENAVDTRGLLEHLLPDLDGCVVVAHAAAIERAFLGRLLREHRGVPLPNPFVDTMSIERRLLQAGGVHVREQHGDLALDACRRRRGLPAYTQHSAAADALACAELLLAQLAEFGPDARVRLADLR